MELEFIKKAANHVEFKLVGETHTFANLLKAQLANDPSVEFVAYKLEHPQDKDALFVLKTKGKSAKSVLVEAAKHLHEELGDLKSAFSKALK
jgi:DNA-directed RNA polymerase subunit L